MSLFNDRPPLVEFIVRPHMVKKALENTRPYDVFHPSSWGMCPRKTAYQYYNHAEKFLDREDSDVDARMERIFDNGHGMHARWQNYLDGAGVLRGYWRCKNQACGIKHGEGELLGIINPARTTKGWTCKCGNASVAYEEIMVKSTQYNFEGHVDAVVDVSGNPQLRKGNGLDVFVVDMKSMKDEMFGELQEAKREHVIQVHIYMWLLNLTGAVVVYENKDNQALKEMFVPMDDNLVEQIKKQAEWLLLLLKNRKLPKRPAGFSRAAFPCRMCEFARLCFA
jgi:CRISPR/Cas system-associated exonuclease Cas4 (RecB family)